MSLPPPLNPNAGSSREHRVPLYGRSLHLQVTGEGAVTVIFDGADGAGTVAWDAVVHEIGDGIRSVCYDRAGYGWSDPAPVPASADESAQDLHRVLAHAGIPGPFLLVGHGYGGDVLRSFARRYRREVIGMVLLHEEPEVTDPLSAPASPALVGPAPGWRSLLTVVARIGLPVPRRALPRPLRAAARAVERHGRRFAATWRARALLAYHGECTRSRETEGEAGELRAPADLPLVTIDGSGPGLASTGGGADAATGKIVTAIHEIVRSVA